MAALKRAPKPAKKPPARQSVGRERAQKPIREVIHHPSERIPLHSVGAASKLKGTIRGVSSSKGKTKEAPPLKPLPPRFNIKPDGTVMTPKEMYDTYAASGQYDVSQAQIDSYANLYNQALAAQQARNPVSTVVSAVGSIISDIPGIVTGDAATIADANAQATIAMDVIRGNHTTSQTSVGGTKGSKTIVDRSAANKKAWITRKQLYGSSGQKGK